MFQTVDTLLSTTWSKGHVLINWLVLLQSKHMLLSAHSADLLQSKDMLLSTDLLKRKESSFINWLDPTKTCSYHTTCYNPRACCDKFLENMSLACTLWMKSLTKQISSKLVMLWLWIFCNRGTYSGQSNSMNWSRHIL